jgi:tetrapyrrole methylase family protein/MazG family protein
VSLPRVTVVGLGPSDASLVTVGAADALRSATIGRLRTRQHPAASAFSDIPSYDDFYESATSFEELYEAIVSDLVLLATSATEANVVYAVPGSPMVAERTVELLLKRTEIEVVLEPAVSVIDLVCTKLGRDPMATGLRIEDALASGEMLRGPGPLLVLQTYSQAVLAAFSQRLSADVAVIVLHHLGLEDQQIVTLRASDLQSFSSADHLTSLWIDELRTAGTAMDDLVELTRRLRRDCPWDQEQTHASLTRHLLEESYEVIDALEVLTKAQAENVDVKSAAKHVEEELGDLLFQVIFHAELGDEESQFTLVSIADRVREKLIGRHPHVFAGVLVENSDDVANRWEQLKKKEKQRESITDGIAWQSPSLTLYTKLLRKRGSIAMPAPSGAQSLEQAKEALAAIALPSEAAPDASATSAVEPAWADVLGALVDAAQWSGVDLEGVLRLRALALRDQIVLFENDPSRENEA